MPTSEQRIIRRTVWHLFLVAVAPLVMLTVALFVVLLRTAYDEDRLYDLVVANRFFWVGGLAVATAVFTRLQIRFHPFQSPTMAKWLLSAGWDGKRPIHGFSTGIHWSEWSVIAGVIAIESLCAGCLSVCCVLAWMGVRLILFWPRLKRFGEVSTVQLSRVFAFLLLLFAEWPIVILLLSVLLMVYVEKSAERALRRWANQALTVDNYLLPELAVKKQRDRDLFPWHDLNVDVVDPRPAVSTRIWIVIGIAAWAYLVSVRLDQVIFSMFGPDNEEAHRLLQIQILALVGLPIAVIAAWRAVWYSLSQWAPSPGIWARIAQRRLIVWDYDKPWLILLPIPFLTFAIAGLVRAGSLPLAVQAVVVATSATAMLLFFSVDPIHWRLTAPAVLTRRSEHRNNNQKSVLQGATTSR